MELYRTLFTTVCLGSALLLFGACTITYNTAGSPKASEVPEAQDLERASHMRTLAEQAVSMGFGGSSWRDFAGVPFAFTVVTEAGKPVPYANVIVDLDTLGRLRIGTTNAQGQIRLAFSEAMLRRNPAVVGVKGGQFYGMNFSFTASAEIGEPLQVVELRALAQQEVGPDVLWYSPSITAHRRALFADMLRRQRTFIERYFGLSPIPLGIALVDTSGSVAVSPSEIQVENRMVNVFPYALRDEESPMNIATANVHEWVEQSLGAAFVKVPRWIGDGLAEYARLALYRSLSAEERRRLEVENWFLNTLPKLRQGLEEAMEGRDTFNLLKWPYASLDYPLTAQTQATGYGVAMSFWNDVIEAEGDSIIKRFLRALPRDESISTQEAVEVLEEVTGTGYSARLRSYPLAAVEDFLASVEEEILGANR